MKTHKRPYPMQVGRLGPDAVVLAPNTVPYLIQKRGADESCVDLFELGRVNFRQGNDLFGLHFHGCINMQCFDGL